LKIYGLENREYGCRNPSRWPRGTLYPQKLVLTLPTSGGRSVGIVRSRTQTTEFLEEIRWGDVDWIDMAQDRNRWRALVNEVMSLRVP
jgi:hypothetical protein